MGAECPLSSGYDTAQETTTDLCIYWEPQCRLGAETSSGPTGSIDWKPLIGSVWDGPSDSTGKHPPGLIGSTHRVRLGAFMWLGWEVLTVPDWVHPAGLRGSTHGARLEGTHRVRLGALAGVIVSTHRVRLGASARPNWNTPIGS